MLLLRILTVVLTCHGWGSAQSSSYPTSSYVTLMSNDTLINADLWDEEPKIFTANYAFEGIEGIEGTTQEAIEAAGGAWVQDVPARCSQVVFPVRTSAQTPSGVATGWGWPTYQANGMPIVFSWPVKASTVNNTDFLITLNTGEQVFPDVVSLNPNAEWNERSTIVAFGHFGNRITPGTPGAEYAVRVEIVDDGSPLMLVGPNGRLFNAVGLSYDASCCPPYGPDAKGPTLVAAKLSRYSDAGEYDASDGALWPNSCSALYGNASTQYRLRMFTSGGFSPDGVSAMSPETYSDWFRIHVSIGDGQRTMTLDEAGVEYSVPLGNGETGTLKILGMADLGALDTNGYDACYISDADNYIDICMVGSEAAARKIVALEMPAGNSTADPEGVYKPLYNPGGPGPNPAPGVNYTNPSPYTYQSVRMSIDDAFTVTVTVTDGGKDPPCSFKVDPGCSCKTPMWHPKMKKCVSRKQV